jgi:hypothetical protein
MKDSNVLVRSIARCLVILLVVSLGDAGPARAQQSSSSLPEQSNTPTQSGQQQSGASAGASEASGEPAKTYPDAPNAQQNGQSENTPSGTEAQQTNDAKPLGTAAAPYSQPSGVMGSRPAGVVIAPARQRRVRAIWISVGLVAGAAIAIGTVAALSHGSPSRP